MPGQMNDQSPSSNGWLKSYYYLRFAVSAAWVVAAFTVAKSSPPLAAAMLVAYPAWDALANYIDARRTGGLGRNKSQLLNFAVSIVATIAVAIALGHSMNAVLSVYGVWAVVSGVFQLLTAARRWKTNGAQWPMILSGAQSALAGLFFVKMAGGTEIIGIANVAPYAAFGAFYFFVSALWLSVSDVLRKSPRVAS
ncbi:hypothetical protein BFX40_05095 [Mesorhizobium sp. SEMIA 3007]|jgi:uncharacterized membrane protein HdeD (DUF308 family)|uniref:DUF308 domain-containing protein n=1 Tax=Mesorhizobium jarvisii TaxID=1777867 RepID=A0A6M7TCE9_9HYPH|nr:MULTISPECIES: DUF308 domain-containing protein [Mesorhizobium]AID33597.2 DUF308 domain-containing protein [Mesorhizobium huakuii 7653R]MCH4555617.1 DUF308 domain-containing protein [Mesorhizobium jarvisii]OBQ60563.1 hypothetical protein A9K72_24300 [Mesorhizobium loti]ODA92330.1 hypothetical protein BFX40_05095 [Mesorhizobium sp. SEMIA 3007]QKC61513.1 DUF308 domain-containing protein [Mesorhizobium jarvisii]